MKKIITIWIAIMVSISFVNAIGITYPYPQNIELKPGQSSYFTFQIQSDDFPLTCIPIVQDNAGLELAFNPEYGVEADQNYDAKPQIIIPKKTPYGNYKATFCMECSPDTDVQGSKVISKICNLPITANVVSERTGRNVNEEISYFYIWITFLIIAIIVLALIIFYLIRKRSKSFTLWAFILII